jgi:hypothetical protein
MILWYKMKCQFGFAICIIKKVRQSHEWLGCFKGMDLEKQVLRSPSKFVNNLIIITLTECQY